MVISSHKEVSELNFSFDTGLHKGKNTKFGANSKLSVLTLISCVVAVSLFVSEENFFIFNVIFLLFLE